MNNYNIDPYYDNFNEDKNYYGILFKPGVAVQARELTQLQTILRDQIAKFGNHIFRHGSVVIPGNSISDLEADYVKVTNQYLSQNVDVTTFVGLTLVGQTSGAKGKVRYVVPTDGTDPSTLYINYVSGGSTSNTFLDGEILLSETNSTKGLTVVPVSSTGKGSLGFVNAGVYYVNGVFVKVQGQTTVISKYSQTPSARVVFKIVESIISSDDDSTLLDPAQGSDNYSAPGADRIQIKLELTTLSLDQIVTDNYIELMRYNQGVLEEHARYPKYSELEKSLARRTYDESGNYISDGLKVSLQEHARIGLNNGKYIGDDGDTSKFIVNVSPGKAYLEGFETESIYTQSIILDKARTPAHEHSGTVSTTFNQGTFLRVCTVKTLPVFAGINTVNLYNVMGSSGGTLIGTAKVLGIEYETGDLNTSDCVYRLYVTDISLSNGYAAPDIGSVRFSGGSMDVVQKFKIASPTGIFASNDTITVAGTNRTGTIHSFYTADSILYVHKSVATQPLPLLSDRIVSSGAGSPAGIVSALEVLSTLGGSASILPLSIDNLKRLGDSIGTRNITYVVAKQFQISLSGGSGSYVLSGAEFLPKSAFTVAAFTSAGPITYDKISISGNTLTISGTGLGSATAYVVAGVTKTAVSEKTKTKTSITMTGLSEVSGVVMLGKSDIISITSVTTATDGDVTARYSLDKGQTDFYYAEGFLTRTGLPVTGPISVTFDYFEHSTVGDYFSVDSYASMGANYLETIPSYTSSATGKVYDLKSSLDFRPILASANRDLLINDSRISTGYINYVPRIDSVVFDKSGKASVISGTPALIPVKPVVPHSSMELCTLFVSGYTPSVGDITISVNQNNAYRMPDIASLDNRISNLEYFSTLTAEEQYSTNYSITDPVTGLDRFKAGYIVDNFDHPSGVSDYLNPLFGVTYRKVHDESVITPSAYPNDVALSMLASSTGYRVTGNIVTLPYTEVVFAKQGKSSHVSNINPFSVFSWNGTMTITPNQDSWVETIILPTITDGVAKVNTSTTSMFTVGPTSPVTPAPTLPLAIDPPALPVANVHVGQTVSRTYQPTVPGQLPYNIPPDIVPVTSVVPASLAPVIDQPKTPIIWATGSSTD